jgi:hypothetical protein
LRAVAAAEQHAAGQRHAAAERHAAAAGLFAPAVATRQRLEPAAVDRTRRQRIAAAVVVMPVAAADMPAAVAVVMPAAAVVVMPAAVAVDTGNLNAAA